MGACQRWYQGTAAMTLSTRAEQAAPAREPGVFEDILYALHQYRADLLRPPSPDSRERRIAMIDALIAKVAGQ